jgi:phosphocarrier protein HPr
MVSQEVEIVNQTGLHTRPGHQFVKEAKMFDSDITIRRGNDEFNAKSLIKLMKVGVVKGDKIEIICSGSDEQTALTHLSSFISNLTE